MNPPKGPDVVARESESHERPRQPITRLQSSRACAASTNDQIPDLERDRVSGRSLSEAGPARVEPPSNLTRLSILVDVPHVRQSFNWDCGLACMLMVLRSLGVSRCNLQGLRLMCNTTSIWTVDLAYMLSRFGIPVHFFTITLGANPAFAKETFYMDNMEEDGRRVERLFRDAPRSGIRIECRSLSISDIRCFLLSGQWLLVVLVDKRKLNHPWQAATEGCLPNFCGLGSGYTGHYVVLCGYDGERREFVVRDPASSTATLLVSEAGLDEARMSFGTDEDLLLISRTTPDPRVVDRVLGQD